MTIPNRIFLQINDDTWCVERINETDIEYVRLDAIFGAFDTIEQYFSENGDDEKATVVNYIRSCAAIRSRD